MNENDKKGAFPITGVLLVLAALGFLRMADLPFFGSRPRVPEIREISAKPDARLWQDPFGAVLDHHAKIKAKALAERVAMPITKTAASISEQMASRSGGGRRVTVLGVMVFSSPYAEETELRLRWRYAVLSGIDESGYVPEDSEHIDFARIDPVNHDVSMANIMPFEWLADENGNSVLVLWINENVFGDRPLTRLGALAKALGVNRSFKIIGPAGSSCLHRMLEQLEGFDDRLSGIEIYSASATIDDALLWGIMAGKGGPGTSTSVAREAITRLFADRGIVFRRTIATDRQLAEILVKELARRHVTQDDRIMLVTEWDTLYARKLLRIYQDVMKESGIPGDRLLRFSYLRGIDGRLPGEEEEKKPEKPDTPELESDVRNLERPIGKSQFDYLRRLAGEALRLEQAELRPEGGPIRAIGILGSDFYDKYLALQALRQKFPHAIFFTTDLDARLLHPANIEWTRNLVVASSFGLSLPKCGSGKIPLSFRNNYQSSIYFATQLALGAGNPGELDDAKQPRIFEIGRYNPVELMPGNTANKCRVSPGKRIFASGNLRVAGKMAVLGALLFALLYFSSHKVRSTVNSLIIGHIYLTAGLGIAVLGFSGWILLLLDAPGQEPFSLNEGLSVWPTEILRLISAFLSCYFLVFAAISLRKSNQEIAADFDLAAPAEPGGGPDGSLRDGNRENAGFFRHLSGKGKKFLAAVEYDWDVPNGQNGFGMGELWAEYLRRDSLYLRIVRMSPILLFYIALCVAILEFFGYPVVPVRGTGSRIFDKTALSLSVGLFILLTFYVFDVTRTCRRFIDLAGGTFEWPKDSVMKFCSKERFDRGEGIEEWMVIFLIARRTDVVGKLIFYPILIWLVLFLARLDYFDNWHLPMGLGIVLTLGALYAWSSAFVLRRSAERARNTVLQRLTKRMAENFAGKEQDQNLIRQIEFALGEVKSNREGAFAPFTHHPLLQSLMIPFGGVGGWYLFDFLSQLTR